MQYYFIWFCLTVLYTPIFYELYISRWAQIDYTHAYFVLPVSLWIAWEKRTDLQRYFKEHEYSRRDYFGLVFLALGLLLFVFGWRQQYLSMSTFSLIPVLWGTIRYLYGPEVAKKLGFPVFYLIFLVPPPLGILDAVTLPLRYGISQATETILSVLHYPISRKGLLLTMGDSDIFMGAPCSGLRSLITMFALAVAYLFFVRADLRKRLMMILAVVPFALIGNLVRVLSLCLVTYYFGQEVAEGPFHYGSGAVIFVIMVFCFMGLEKVLDRSQKQKGRGE